MPKSLAVAVFLLLVGAAVCADVDPKAARELYNRVSPSLVVVEYTYDGELGRREIRGTGIVVRDDGLVMASMSLTPNQIPDEQMKDFKIIIPGDDETELEAAFCGRDERTGLTFVKANQPRQWTVLKFEDVSPDVGDPVLSIGMLGKDAAYKTYLTTATVSATLRGPMPQVLVSGEGLGNVGSPVLNVVGQAIGIVHRQGEQTPFLDDPRNPLGAIDKPPRHFVPARDFLFSLDDPPKPGEPMKYPHIGVSQLSGLSKEVAEYFGLRNQPAVQIGDVIEGFAADQAGLRSGDVIVKVDGQALERGDQPEEVPLILIRRIMRMSVGQTVVFTVLSGRDQPMREVAVTLGERPMPASRARRFFAEDLGFTARQMVFEDTYARRLPVDTRGVVIALIKPSSSAQTAKLQNGDLVTKINQTPVEDLDQFRSEYEAFRKDRPREAVVLEVLRGVNTQVIRIEPPQ